MPLDKNITVTVIVLDEIGNSDMSMGNTGINNKN